jgi:HAMP domain-containing protein
MQSIILLILIPSLLLLTVVMGGVIYSTLRATILNGFEKKLSSLSTVTASFIKGDDHQRILLARSIVGLTMDPKTKTLYGYGARTHSLVRIDPSTGGASDIGDTGSPGIEDIAFDPKSGAILGIIPSSGLLVRINPQTGAGQPLARTRPGLRSLVFDPQNGQLFGIGDVLCRIDPITGNSAPIGSTGFSQLTGLAFDPKEKKLYAVDQKSSQLVALDATTGKGKAVGIIRPPTKVPEPGSPEEVALKGKAPPPEPPLTIQALAFDPNTRKLYGAGDQLVTIDPQSALADNSFSTPGYRNEADSRYQQYYVPMHNIMQKKNVTYLYTFIVQGKDGLVYGLDGTEGADHSPVGSEDVLPEVDAPGVREVAKGARPLYLSDIQPNEGWGLLKSAYAPIYDSKGKPVGLTGCDVNVDVIRTKTNAALAEVGYVALVSLLIAGLVSLAIARSLTRPINAVKEAALQVAAGQYGQNIQVKHPYELAKLAGSFNEMSQTLATTVSDLTETNQTLERRRRMQELNRRLAQATDEDPADSNRLIYGWCGGKSHCPVSSGSVFSPNGQKLLVWLADCGTDPLLAVKQRSEIALVAERLMARTGGEWNALSGELDVLFMDGVYCFVLLDSESRKIQSLARRSTPATLVEENGRARNVDLMTTPKLDVQSKQAFVIADLGDTNLLASIPPLSSSRHRAEDLLAEIQREWLDRSKGAPQSKDGLIAIMAESV